MGRKKFFKMVHDEIVGLTPAYLRVWCRTQGYVFRVEIFCLLVDFSKIYFVAIDGKHCLPKIGEERVFASHLMDFCISIFMGKHNLSQLTYMDGRCFKLSRDEHLLFGKEFLWVCQEKKWFGCVGLFFGLEVEYLWLAIF